MTIPEAPERTHEVEGALRAVFDWDYDAKVDELRTLYAKSLDTQWQAFRDLEWDRAIDPGALAATPMMGGVPIEETRFWTTLAAEVRQDVARRAAAFTLSNFLHGEQGAMFVAGQLVSAVPDLDGKFYAATQAVDEARHVEVFAAYLARVGGTRPVAPMLGALLDDLTRTDDWLEKALGMNVVLEGLALFSFRDLRRRLAEPLLVDLLTLVARDEARHTGFGVLYLRRAVARLDEARRTHLEDFAFESARRVIDVRLGRSMGQSMFDVWAEASIDPADAVAALRAERDVIAAARRRQGTTGGALGSFILPLLERIGLFSDRIRGHFDELFRAASGTGRGLEGRLGTLPDDLDAWVAAAE